MQNELRTFLAELVEMRWTPSIGQRIEENKLI